MYTVIVDTIKKNEFNVLGLLCKVLYGKKNELKPILKSDNSCI